MQHSAATVVCAVGDDVTGQVARLAASNVGVCSPPVRDDAFERAMVAGSAAASAHTAYFVHDADPLEAVVQAWVRLFDGNGAIGELEVVVAETAARWRARSLELPDYYLVVDSQTMTATRRHWYFGVLHGAAPSRVVPVTDAAGALIGALDDLRPTRWWPKLPELLDRIEHRSPESLETEARGPEMLVPGS